MSTPLSTTTAPSIVYRAKVSPEAWAIIFRGVALEGYYETQREADEHLDSLLAIGGDTPAATPIQRVIRSKAVMRWLRADLPGCGNSIGDLASGYASWLGCDLSEVTVGESLLHDSDFLSWVDTRFSNYVTQHDLGLLR